MLNPQPSKRDFAITEAVRLITNLLRCVIWLIRHGVFVTSFSGYHVPGGVDHVKVCVAASPYLYTLLGSDAAWQKRRQEGCLTIYTWFAIRFGIRIEWEEVCASPMQ